MKRLDSGLLIDTLHGVWSALESTHSSHGSKPSANPAAFTQERSFSRVQEGPVEKVFRSVLSQLNPSQLSDTEYQRYIPASDQVVEDQIDHIHWCYTAYDVIISELNAVTQFTPLNEDSNSDSENSDICESTLKAMLDLHDAIPESDSNSEQYSQNADSIGSQDLDLLQSMVPAEDGELGVTSATTSINHLVDGGLNIPIYDYNYDSEPMVPTEVSELGIVTTTTSINHLIDGGLDVPMQGVGETCDDAISVDEGSHVSNTPPSKSGEGGSDNYSTPPLQQWRYDTTPQVVPGQVVETNPVPVVGVSTPASSDELFASQPTATSDEVLFPTPPTDNLQAPVPSDSNPVPFAIDPKYSNDRQPPATSKNWKHRKPPQVPALQTTKNRQKAATDTSKQPKTDTQDQKLQRVVLEALTAAKQKTDRQAANRKKKTSSLFKSPSTTTVKFKHSLVDNDGRLAVKVRKVNVEEKEAAPTTTTNQIFKNAPLIASKTHSDYDSPAIGAATPDKSEPSLFAKTASPAKPSSSSSASLKKQQTLPEVSASTLFKESTPVDSSGDVSDLRKVRFAAPNREKKPPLGMISNTTKRSKSEDAASSSAVYTPIPILPLSDVSQVSKVQSAATDCSPELFSMSSFNHQLVNNPVVGCVTSQGSDTPRGPVQLDFDKSCDRSQSHSQSSSIASRGPVRLQFDDKSSSQPTSGAAATLVPNSVTVIDSSDQSTHSGDNMTAVSVDLLASMKPPSISLPVGCNSPDGCTPAKDDGNDTCSTALVDLDQSPGGSVFNEEKVNVSVGQASTETDNKRVTGGSDLRLTSALRSSSKAGPSIPTSVRFDDIPTTRCRLTSLHNGRCYLRPETGPPSYASLLQLEENVPPRFAAIQEKVTTPTTNVGFVHSSKLRYRPLKAPPSVQELIASGVNDTIKSKKGCILSNLTQPTALATKSPLAGRVKENKGLLKGELPTLIMCCLDVIADVGESEFPDPSKDEILLLAMTVHNSAHLTDSSSDITHVVASEKVLPLPALSANIKIHPVASEQVLVITTLRLITEIDPDILLGWDIQRFSFGYLSTRAHACNIDVAEVLGRAPSESRMNPTDKKDTSTVIKISGRIMMNCWRTMRSELRLASDTLQAAVKYALGKSIPRFSHKRISILLKHQNPSKRSYAANHLVSTITLSVEVCCHLDTINRTVELARLYGIQFTEILTRGSQFRVENMFVRLAKPLNYLMISPSRVMVEQQNRQEGVPFVMEPHSNYYNDPVIVLDFRSLYPSIVIAYNLCYSTCVGKISNTRRKKIGPIDNYNIPKEFLNSKTQKNQTFIAPNSCGYVTPEIRKGLFPRMLSEILGTRFAVQDALKKARAEGDVVTEAILNSRQIGLKMIANVTYGYTAATMSGRMPCSDIADSIVLLARQTLERIIKDVETHPTWCAKVIYGDTDSLFVCLPGSTVKRAFEVGQQIVQHASATNPSPVKLKLEKVYKPCIMVTKKRYVGNAYEAPDSEPKFDAKGVECIRRDQCRATSKIQEMALRRLFETNSLEEVKKYVQKQLQKIQVGDINSHDLILRQEVKLGTYANPSQLPPSATVAREMIKNDHLSEPLFNERVPYLVANSKVVRLSDMVIHPLALLGQKVPSITVNSTYYITKQICPPLERVLGLAGANITNWLMTIPRSRQHGVANSVVKSVGSVSMAYQMQGKGEDDAQEILKCANRSIACTAASGTLHDYVTTSLCVICRSEKSPTVRPVCVTCSANPMASKMVAAARKSAALEQIQQLHATCSNCSQTEDCSIFDSCTSLDCTVPWKKQRAQLNLAAAEGALELW
eukprot:TRINITY_DN13293_c0_g1_i1.p1 TRINITY_DN13293_c0_g1~~TRINITY_DN13293_c0_g1_i1.p1  ORF type:complete len:2077 (+),score=379.85 TRINITY_DN13293_c0_g1_i1:815-6232(+)